MTYLIGNFKYYVKMLKGAKSNFKQWLNNFMTYLISVFKHYLKLLKSGKKATLSSGLTTF